MQFSQNSSFHINNILPSFAYQGFDWPSFAYQGFDWPSFAYQGFT